MEIRPNFLNQLAVLEKKYAKKGFLSNTGWNETDGLTEEELVLRNTYINAQLGPIVEEVDNNKEKSFIVNWTDNGEDNKEKLVDVPHPSSKNPIENGVVIIKSCLKGGIQEKRVPILKPKKKFNKVEELFGNVTNATLKVNKLNGDELQKLTDSLEESLKNTKKNPKLGSKTALPNRSLSASSKLSKEKHSPIKKPRPKTGASPNRSKRS